MFHCSGNLKPVHSTNNHKSNTFAIHLDPQGHICSIEHQSVRIIPRTASDPEDKGRWCLKSCLVSAALEGSVPLTVAQNPGEFGEKWLRSKQFSNSEEMIQFWDGVTQGQNSLAKWKQICENKFIINKEKCISIFVIYVCSFNKCSHFS